MGKFTYGSPSSTVEFDDRLLAHLRVVIAAKLRRGESFLFTWDYGVDSGSGHSSVWLHPAIPLQFDFNGNRDPALNRVWLEALTHSSNSATGLRVMPEPGGDPSTNVAAKLVNPSPLIDGPTGRNARH